MPATLAYFYCGSMISISNEITSSSTCVDEYFRIGSTIKTDRVIELDGVTYPYVTIDVSSKSHPFYTGKLRTVASEGNVARFTQRFGRFGRFVDAKKGGWFRRKGAFDNFKTDRTERACTWIYWGSPSLRGVQMIPPPEDCGPLWKPVHYARVPFGWRLEGLPEGRMWKGPGKHLCLAEALIYIPLASGRLAPLWKRSKRYAAKNDHREHFMLNHVVDRLDDTSFTMWIQT